LLWHYAAEKGLMRLEGTRNLSDFTHSRHIRTFTPNPLSFYLFLIHWIVGIQCIKNWGEGMEKKRIAVFDYDAPDCAHTAEVVRQYYRQQGAETEVVELTGVYKTTHLSANSKYGGMRNAQNNT